MRVYEELFIVKPDAPEEEVDAFIGQIKDLITNGKGTVDKADKWGTRKLAYRVQKYNEGIYVLLQFSSSPELVKEIERRMRVTDLVIKFITVRIEGGRDAGECRRVAYAIAHSPLVKTAIAGEDPNWGRIVAAVGKAGEAADRDTLAIWLGDILVAKDGEVAPDYREAQGAAYMKQPEIAITVDVGVGKEAATIWACDLTKDYIAINADYRS